MASSVVERYDARPYAFFFSTLLAADPVPDGEGGELEVVSKEIQRSGTYFLNGRVLRGDQLDEEKDEILITNMRCNGWPLVVETVTSWRTVHPFLATDFVVDGDGTVVDRGDAPEHEAYRASALALSGRTSVAGSSPA